jgi:Dullard-like phosphatase family protein
MNMSLKLIKILIIEMEKSEIHNDEET